MAKHIEIVGDRYLLSIAGGKTKIELNPNTTLSDVGKLAQLADSTVSVPKARKVVKARPMTMTPGSQLKRAKNGKFATDLEKFWKRTKWHKGSFAKLVARMYRNPNATISGSKHEAIKAAEGTLYKKIENKKYESLVYKK